MERTDITIIGAGVVGLAIARRLSQSYKSVIVVERHQAFGQESSSRNSEVIHSGIYYPEEYLKTKLCVEGRNLLYEFCEKFNIAHKRIGKLIVTTHKSELKDLESLLFQGRRNGISDLKLLTKDEIEKIEPNIRAICAITSPSTGIVDSHQLMRCLERQAKDNGVIFAYGCEVINIEKKGEGYQIEIIDADGERLFLFTQFLINSAGLFSDKIAEMVGIDVERAGYKLHYSKGEYFRLSANKAKLVNRLIYPVPKETSLGIHTVADLQGQVRLGPNAFDVEEIDYDVDVGHKSEFYESAKRFLPFLELEDLSPDMAGIRPKLKNSGEQDKDFIISREDDKGFRNLINLIGIESPGLTASLAMAKYVTHMMQ